MKKSIIAVLFALISVNSVADTGKHYVFGQLGVGTASGGLFDEFWNTYSLHHGKGVTGRIGIGHEFNSYFSVESGVAFYPSVTRIDNPKIFFIPLDEPAASAKISDLASLDIMAKASLPIKAVKLYVTGGASATHAKYGAPNIISDYTFKWAPGSKTYITPKLGVGLNVALNSKISLDFAAMVSPSKGDIGARDYLPHLQAATMGIQWRLS